MKDCLHLIDRDFCGEDIRATLVPFIRIFWYMIFVVAYVYVNISIEKMENNLPEPFLFTK